MRGSCDAILLWRKSFTGRRFYYRSEGAKQGKRALQRTTSSSIIASVFWECGMEETFENVINGTRVLSPSHLDRYILCLCPSFPWAETINFFHHDIMTCALRRLFHLSLRFFGSQKTNTTFTIRIPLDVYNLYYHYRISDNSLRKK